MSVEIIGYYSKWPGKSMYFFMQKLGNSKVKSCSNHENNYCYDISSLFTSLLCQAYHLVYCYTIIYQFVVPSLPPCVVLYNYFIIYQFLVPSLPHCVLLYNYLPVSCAKLTTLCTVIQLWKVCQS